MSTADQHDFTQPEPVRDPKAEDSGAQEAASQDETASAAEPNPLRDMKVADVDASTVWSLGLRDLAAFAVVLSIYGGAASWALATDLGLAHFVVGVVGFFGGGILASVAHEWGHFAGARWGGGHAPTKPFKAFPQVYDFDYKNNDARSFLWMSYGGNLGNWGMALFLAIALPLGSIGPDALVAGAVAFSVFSALVEFPVIRRVRDGMAGYDALMMIPKDFTTRYVPQALAAGLVTFIIL